MELIERLRGDMTEYQSIPFWSWNDKLVPDALRAQIRRMKAAGIGGFFMHARGGLTTEYLSDEWFEAAAACIDEAELQGMHAWCYDENGWPSGFAGMKLLADPANWAHYLVCEERPAPDPAALAAYALEDGVLTRVREGDAAGPCYCLYDRTNSSVVDILNAGIVRKFIDETHEKYHARFALAFGRAMQGFFTDEPQYFRWDTAYSPVLPGEYQREYGEDLLDELGALFVDCAQAPRLRYRYWKLMNRLYTESFARQIFEWCEAHNCKLTGHSIEERDLFWQMICCAGIMPFYEYEHVPGIDWLGREIGNEVAPRQVSSAAQQLGKKHVLTETFACAGWDVTPRELKRIAEWQYVHGVNQMCQHLYPYTIRGQRKRDYPAFYSEHNPWTCEFKRFNDYFTALGYMLAESREAADVGVIHPIHSAYLTFKRGDEHSTDALDASFAALVESLGAAGIGHHYIDESLLARHGRVEGAKLVMGLCRYRFVIVPDMDVLDESTARLLREYAQNGGKLLLAGRRPTLVGGEAADLSFLKTNCALDDMIDPRAAISRRDTEIRFTYREADFGRFVFAVNLSKTRAYSVEFTLEGKGAKRFDAMNRAFEPLHFVREEGRVRVPLAFAPGDSFIIMLDDSAKSAGAPRQALPGRPLPLAARVAERDENALTLDTASISYDGQRFGPELPIMAASDRLLRERRNGTVYLKYSFAASARPARVRLESERMGARRARLNGAEIALTEPGRLGAGFYSADITALVREGANELVYEIDYRQSEEVYRVFNGVYYEHSDGTESLINCLSYETDVEAVYLFGDFGVAAGRLAPGPKNTLVATGGFALSPAAREIPMNRVLESGYLFFGGSIAFETEFDAEPGETRLRLAGRWAVARVQVNGGAERVLMFTDECDLAGDIRPGKNRLRVTLLSSYRNLLGPFHVAGDPEPYGVSPDTFTNYGHWSPDGRCPLYTPAYAFARFGIDALTLSRA